METELRKRISIVVPVYNEGAHIRNSMAYVGKICEDASISYELVLIDDGSSDTSWEVISGMAKEDERIVAVRLSRNFGKEPALCAGLDIASGDAVIVMDADLQHPPERIPEMVRLWQEGAEVVEGVKSSRGKEKWTYRVCAKLFYGMINKATGIEFNNASDFKLLDRKVVEAMKHMPEKMTFFRGMSAWVGFERRTFEFEVAERVDGASKWSLKRLITLAVTAVTSYTSAPLHCITVLGFVMFLGAILLGIQTLYMKIAGYAQDGFTTVILLLLLIGSMIMISLGIIGLYLMKIYHEIKGRPRYLTSRIIRQKEEEK
ncbi:MAG: glycosyltransferase family 2 protein [Lachnospiraceae bacterium]|nr:glycosyltransferase family 2 protein [Lachnospiraceae bacterium]